jgi:hypothetical protein
MKAEHRHELKTNDLAKSLMTFPDYVKVYGAKALLGLAIVVLVVVLIVQRIGNSHTQAAKARDDLAYARSQIERLTHVSVLPDGRVTVRPGEIENVRGLLQQVRNDTSDKSVLAAAAVAQGDYAWGLANYPDLPEAATQPAFRPDRDRGELLKEAQNAWQEVVSNYPDQKLSVIAARFGLGALAENQSKWDDAKAQYDAVMSLASAEKGYSEFKDLAEAKLKRLEALRTPVLVGEVPTTLELPKPELPTTTTAPSTTGPTTSHAIPSTAKPTTRPSGAGPTTRPSGARPTTRPSKPVK